MKNKKEIDKLYQKKLREVRTTPREDVWKNISSRLPEKKPAQRVIPLWYKFAGAAAMIAVILSVGLMNIPSEQISGTALTEQTNEISKRTVLGERGIVSEAYNEKMTKSGILLEALVKNTERVKILEQLRKENNIDDKITTSKTGIFTDIVKTSEVPEFGDQSYTFFDHNEKAFQAEQKEKPMETNEPEDLPSLLAEANNPEEDDNPEEDIVKEKMPSSKRLSLSTTAAAIYSDNLGSGNTLDAQFANNKSSGQMSLSYGVNIAYQISEKVKLRSGVNIVDMSYSTEDIPFHAAVNSAALDTEFRVVNFASPAEGLLNQRLGFIEIPLELEYALINKKIGLNIIGGASTLFLDENQVSLDSPGYSTNLGQANNLNNTSFSTNIGIGVDYNLSQRFQLNLEPIFKYQLNTFSNTSGVNPYNFGVYSGLSFKF